jgi:hypothetical protein
MPPIGSRDSTGASMKHADDTAVAMTLAEVGAELGVTWQAAQAERQVRHCFCRVAAQWIRCWIFSCCCRR